MKTVASESKTSSIEGDVPERILELRRKIHDPEYMNDAVQRIAIVLSRRIVEKPRNIKEVVNGSY